MLNKNIIISKHALERFEERKLDLSPSDQRKYKANPRKFIENLFSPLNIKSMKKLDNRQTVVIVKGNFRFITIDIGKNKSLVKTMTKTNSRKARKFK